MTTKTLLTKSSHIKNLMDSLAELHKYQCGSDEHRADLAKDAGLKPIPHQDIYGYGVEVPEGLAKDVVSAYCKAEYDKRGATDAKWDEYCKGCDEHADAEMDHNWECYSAISHDILWLLQGSTCSHCGDTHTGYGRDSQHMALEYDSLLMNLFEVIAFELMQRGEDHEYALYKKSDLVERIWALNPEKKQEVA